MKLAELFEAPLGIKRVSGHDVELHGAPGVDTSVDLDSTGRDMRIDPETGTMTTEPSEANETKLAQGLIGQIGSPLSVREQPWPANPTMYIITPDDQLVNMGISLPATGHAGLIMGGRIYVSDPNNLAKRPKVISWKDYFVTQGPNGIALEIERSPAEQAQLIRKMKRKGIPLDVQ
jgi:hypothetical protein